MKLFWISIIVMLLVIALLLVSVAFPYQRFGIGDEHAATIRGAVAILTIVASATIVTLMIVHLVRVLRP